MARIALPDPDDAAAPDAWIFDRIRAERPVPGGRVANIFRLMANAPRVLDLWLPLGTAIRAAPELSPADTVLVILATAVARDSRYEANQNWNAGLRAGLTRAQLEGVADPAAAACYSPAQADLIAFARAVALDARVDAPLWSRVHERLGEARTTGLLFLIGWFVMNSCLTGPAELEMEPGFSRG